MPFSLSSLPVLAKRTVAEVLDDDVPTQSAAIAYATVFSLPPLLVLMVGVAGAVFGADAVREALLGEAEGLLGAEGSAAIGEMVTNAGSLGQGIGAKLAGLLILIVGATGAFGQLQKALNRAWDVEDQPSGGIWGMVKSRLLSFGLVLTLGFMLLVSLGLSAFLSALGDTASALAPAEPVRVLLQVVNQIVSLGVITALFAALYRVLPDAEIAWRDAAVGAVVTAVLFTLGKAAIGLYLGTANPGSAFGAAGSLALILVWIYYSSLIVLVGAEFTQVWATRFGSGIRPDPPGQDLPLWDSDPETPQPAHPAAVPREPQPYSGPTDEPEASV